VDALCKSETGRSQHGDDHERDRDQASRCLEPTATVDRGSPEMTPGRWRGLTGLQPHTGRRRMYRRKYLAVPVRGIALTELVKSVHRSPMAIYRPTTAAGTAESREEDRDEEHHDDHENYRQCSSFLAAFVRGCLVVMRSRAEETSRTLKRPLSCAPKSGL
jgi:hypothetical protein